MRALRQRLLLVKFPMEYVPANLIRSDSPANWHPINEKFKERMIADVQGMANWMIRRAVAWYRERDLKSGAPAKVTAFTRDYFTSEDGIQRFIDEKCVVGRNLRYPSQVLRMAYNDWAKDQDNVKELDGKVFVKAMTLKGFKNKDAKYEGKTSKCYIGIELKQDVVPDEAEVEEEDRDPETIAMVHETMRLQLGAGPSRVDEHGDTVSAEWRPREKPYADKISWVKESPWCFT